MRHAIPQRMRAQGLPLLDDGVRQYVELSQQLYVVQCALGQARGHVRIRLEHIESEMRSELDGLELAIRALEPDSAAQRAEQTLSAEQRAAQALEVLRDAIQTRHTDGTGAEKLYLAAREAISILSGGP